LAQLIEPFVGLAADRLAWMLHREFGSVNAVLAAHVGRLRRLLPDHPGAVNEISRVSDIINHCARLELRRPTGKMTGRTLIEFLRHRIGFEPVEVIYVFNFSVVGELITDGPLARGSFDECPLMPNEIARGALDVGAAMVIIAHNHPSGDPTPSYADKRMTQKVSDCCRAVGVRLNDHIIVGNPDIVSFREVGLLK